MMYENMMKLSHLEKAKWYEIRKRFRNYKILFKTLRNLERDFKMDINGANLYDTILDFMLGADALKGIVVPTRFGIRIYKSKEGITSYSVNDDCFHVDLLSSTIDDLSIFIDMPNNRMEIKYSIRATTDKWIKDVFMIQKDKRLNDATPVWEETRKFVLSEINYIMEEYIRGVTEYLYTWYIV